ncbi:hypothetical protein [Butyrivibrio sp. AC2005]|uniref:hypothetical protein n=1 Tax=Butyrivibrio sp. AC2005 TaxID=1280672 RepID=UPI0004216C96|nr:hypothetical protein [Butyrivibrio sp. AC2005]
MKYGLKKIIISFVICVVLVLGIILGIDIYKKNIYMKPMSPTEEGENSTEHKENIEESTKEATLGKEMYENESDLEEKIPAAIGSYKPTEVYNFCKDQSISDALFNCTVNQNADYSKEGAIDLGEVFPDNYKDIDLDGDGTTDSISRVIGHTGDGCIYSFEFGNGISFVSAPYTIVPNEGELISFHDFDNDNVDEILITHITESTAGPVAWNCELYTWTGSGWESQWAVDENGAVSLAGVDDVLSGEGNSYYVRDVEFTDDGIMYLIDYGYKNGAEVILDLETIQIKFLGKEIYMEERSDTDKRDELTNKIWPLGI